MNTYKLIRNLGLLVIFLLVSANVFAQAVVNPDGGAGLDDGLKIAIDKKAVFSVYRDNQSQYYSGHTWPEGTGKGVELYFRFSKEDVYNDARVESEGCSSTPIVQNGNDWSTFFTGYVTSSISGKRFHITLAFRYTHPNNYFLVDYFIRAPRDLETPETIHLYLSHDAYILGSDGSRGNMVQNATGHFVGNYRNDDDTNISCNGSKKNPRYPASHGFKTKGEFRSYYTGGYYSKDNINSELKLTNTVSDQCVDDGVAVEFTLGPLAASETKGVQIMHGYGNTKNEFDDVIVSDPEIMGGVSTPVTVNFVSQQVSEPEGHEPHVANSLKIIVSGGQLVIPQVCSFIICDEGTAVQGTDYSYIPEFVIPAGDYSTPQELTLDNFTILGNTTPGKNRTLCIQMLEDSSCDNDIVINGDKDNATLTILEDDCSVMGTDLVVSSCNTLFVDDGVNEDYSESDDSDQTITFRPVSTNDKVRVVFREFNTQTADELLVYSGTTADPNQLLATLSGDKSSEFPLTFYSSDNTGALTFVFTKRSGSPSSGWLAEVRCHTPPVPPAPKPPVLHQVMLGLGLEDPSLANHITLYPAAGEHIMEEGTTMTILAFLSDECDESDIKLLINDNDTIIADEKKQELRAVAYTFRIPILEETVLKVIGVKKNNAISIEGIQSGQPKVYTVPSHVVIEQRYAVSGTEYAERSMRNVRIYTMAGTLVLQREIPLGTTSIPLEKGTYLVVLGDTVVKVVL